MKFQHSTFCLLFWCCLCALLIGLSFNSRLSAQATSEQKLQLHTRSGDLVLAKIPVEPLTFTEIKDTDFKPRQVEWSEIESLQFVKFQLSLQTKRVEELLAQLSDPDYATRENAEELLSDPDQFGPFESLIKNVALKKSNDLELNYRLQQVLSLIHI